MVSRATPLGQNLSVLQRSNSDKYCDVCWPLRVCVVRVVTPSPLLPSPQVVAFVRLEWDGVSVCLSRGVVGSSSALRPRRFRVRSGLSQSSLPTGTPRLSLLLSLLQRCFGSAAGQRFRGRLVGHVYWSVYSLSLPGLFNRDPASLYQRALSGLPETITQLELQSSSFALTR